MNFFQLLLKFELVLNRQSKKLINLVDIILTNIYKHLTRQVLDELQN